MSNSSEVQLFYLPEVSFGQTPAAALTEFRFTGESLGQNTQSTNSQEIRSDRQVPGVARTLVSSSGDVNVELSFAAHDALLEGGFFSDFTTAVNVSVLSDIVASNTNSQFTSTTTDFTAQNMSVGQFIKVGGFAANSGENNGFYQITAIAANALTVTPAPASDEAAGGLTVTMIGQMLRNGTTRKSFTLEKQFTDITEFVSFTGMRVGEVSFNITPGSIITGAFSFDGLNTTAAGATVGTGGPTSAPTNDVLNAVDNVSEIREGGALSTLDITEISFTLNNALRSLPAVGSVNAVGIEPGTIDVTGTFSAYFTSRALYEKYLNFTTTSLSFLTSDGAGNAYLWSFPSVKLTTSEVAAGGIDQDVVVNANFSAFRNAAFDYTIQVDKFPI